MIPEPEPAETYAVPQEAIATTGATDDGRRRSRGAPTRSAVDAAHAPEAQPAAVPGPGRPAAGGSDPRGR